MLSAIGKARVHDLVRIDLESVGDLAAPCWVIPALRSCPWAVVRRTPPAPGEIAVGVRGNTRDQRWGGFISRRSVSTIVRPMDLLVMRSSTVSPRTPAMRVLQPVIERWQDLCLSWGPTGSVALELVSGQHVTTESSDLDVAIDAPSRVSVERARSLLHSVIDLRPNVDIRLETPQCGFSLREYACVSPARILLRYRDGASLGNDPWGPHRTAAGIGA